MRSLPHPDQGDLFAKPLYPTRSPKKTDAPRFRAKVAKAMARAIRESGHDRQTIAALMARELGAEQFSKTTLDAYTAESKASHDISLVRFTAFVRATRAPWLWDLVLEQDGFTVLEGEEARLAEIALLQQEQDRIAKQLRSLRAVPVEPKGWRQRP